MPRSALTETLLADLPLTAASFIVTLYGDVVVPRGEVLAMGSLIELCARLDFRENVVRTAVSRLVAAGQLEGAKTGRRSFYRLAPTARAEFSEAAHVLYDGLAAPERWFVLYAPNLPEAEARRHRMGRMGGDVWLCPDRGETLPETALTLTAQPPSDARALAGFWDLTALQSRYQAMIARFSALAQLCDAGAEITPQDALIARLLLVHVYRGALLRDPGLPISALPEDWQGDHARALFVQLYTQLSPLADGHIATTLEAEDGPLPAQTAQTQHRLAQMGPFSSS